METRSHRVGTSIFHALDQVGYHLSIRLVVRHSNLKQYGDVVVGAKTFTRKTRVRFPDREPPFYIDL